MFNPLSVFPRQTVYIQYPSGPHHLQRAVNAPSFSPGQAPSAFATPNARGQFSAAVAQAVARSGGAPGLVQNVAAVAQRRGMIDDFYSRASQKSGLQRHNARRSTNAPQGRPAVPEADGIVERAAEVVADHATPLSAPASSPLWTPESFPGPSTRLGRRGSVFSETFARPVGTAAGRH